MGFIEGDYLRICELSYALVIARFRVQYDQYDLFYDPLGKNNENIGHIIRVKHAITSLSLAYKISAFC